MNLLRRYWLEFEVSEADVSRYSSYAGLQRGCGVTAYSQEDALVLLREHLFRNDPLPPISKVIEDVDISTLEKNHILPNIGVPSWRGIWYPNL